MRNILLKLLVALLTVMVLVQILRGPPEPKGWIVMKGMKPHSLTEEAFLVDEPTVMSVTATGSADNRHGDAGLATAAWILRLNDQEVVWDMQHRPLKEGRGPLLHVSADTIELEPGLYKAYFASYGQLVEHSGHGVGPGRRDWEFRLQPATAKARVRRLPAVPDGTEGDVAGSLLWDARRLRSSQHDKFEFEVTGLATISVSATGQVEERSSRQTADQFWIESVASGKREWSFSAVGSEYAGGSVLNRKQHVDLELARGVYRAVARTDRSHAYEDWRANPPWYPDAWGMELRVDNPAAVTAFDPWMHRRPVISIMRVTDERDIRRYFQVTRSVPVLVHALGEMYRHSRYDYASLTMELPSGSDEVWSMRYENSERAGGSSKNRRVEAFLVLDPGIYTLRYESDDSHAWGSWNEGAPDHEERWGVTMFPVLRELPSGVIVERDGLSLSAAEEALEGLESELEALESELDALESEVESAAQMDAQEMAVDIAAVRAQLRDAHAAFGAMPDAELIVDWRPLEENERRRHELSATVPVRLGISALGEFTDDGEQSFDYGWIQCADSQERIWAMSWDNTLPAGGEGENRLFAGVVDLTEGDYVVQFITDRTHHFGDFFDDNEPAAPEQWGMAVWRWDLTPDSQDAGRLLTCR